MDVVGAAADEQAGDGGAGVGDGGGEAQEREQVGAVGDAQGQADEGGGVAEREIGGALGDGARRGACLNSLGAPPVDPLYEFVGAAALSLGSLLLFGWLTVPAGAVLGFFLARRQGR